MKNDQVQIACIGQAGENRVHAATIEHGAAASASRGAGIIMGDKKLKAIAVYGTGDVHIADPTKFHELCDQILKRSEKLGDFVDQSAYSISQFSASHQKFFDGEFVGASGEDWGRIHTDFNKEYRMRGVGCHNCGVTCKSAISLPGMKPFFIKCQSWYAYYLLSRTDWATSVAFYRLCEGYGVDTISLPTAISLAIDLYQKGVLTKEDTGGLHLEWRNVEVLTELLKRIVYREGIGDILSKGTHEAAHHFLGKDAEDYHLLNIKKSEQIPFDLYFPSLCRSDGHL